MANPRTGVEFDGIGAVYATFKSDNSTIVYDSTKAGGAAAATINKAVSLSADDTVQLAGDADAVVGKLITVEADNRCVVQTNGFMRLPAGAGATLTRGFKVVGDLDGAARGFIREVASATAAEIVKGRGFIVRNADTAAVVVNL